MDDSIDSGSGQLASKMQGLAHTLGDRPAGATTSRSMNKNQIEEQEEDTMFFHMSKQPKTYDFQNTDRKQKET